MAGIARNRLIAQDYWKFPADQARSAARGAARQDRNGMISSATTFTSLSIGLIAGPAVSLYGSPTVSPVTAALWASEPLPPKLPASMNFLALSQAAPPVVMEIATNSPVMIVPISSPPSALIPAPGPMKMLSANTSTIGTRMGNRDG